MQGRSIVLTRIIALTIVITAIFAGGCSSSGNQPILPNADTNPFDNSIAAQDNSRGLIFDGSMIIDTKMMSINIVERNSAANYNITGFLSSACSGGCFHYTIQSYANEVLTISLKVENPTSLQAYDLRMIFTNLFGKKILNPDNYTNLFDPSGGMPFNPQIAFMKELESRAFPVGSGAFDDEILKLWFPSGSNPNVNFVIAASYPNQCPEPYQIYDIAANGELTTSGGSCELSAKVRDHQNNIQWVAADTRIFTGNITFFQYDAVSGNWKATISNSLSKPEGQYTVYFAAGSPGTNNINLYDSFTVAVTSGPLAFETPRAIDDYTYSAGPDTITEGGKGIRGIGNYVYVIYYITDEIGNQQVDLLRSEDGGDTFLPHIRVNTDDPNSIHICPALDVSPSGTLHAAWCRGDLSGFGSNQEYAQSKNHGASFSQDIYLGGVYLELWCDIAAYDNNIIYVVRNGAPGGGWNLFFDKSTDGGNSWLPDENLSQKIWGSTPFNDLFPVMDVDPSGNIYVVFESDASPEKQSEWNVYLTKSSDSGGNFSTPKKLNDLPGNMRLPNIACDKNGGVHALWVDLDNGTYDDIRYCYSGDGGTTFAPSVVIDDVDSDVNEPVIGIDPNNNTLYVAYVAATVRINKSVNGINWGQSVDTGLSGSGINIYVDGNSRIHLCNSQGGRIYYTRSVK